MGHPSAPVFRYPGIPRAVPFLAAGGGTGAGDKRPPAPGADPGSGKSAGERTGPWSWCRVVGQIGSLYVVLETEDGFVVMDPHAAHERVLFEKFLADVIKGKVQTQGVLMPETIELNPKDAMCVRRSLELLRQMGFGISEFGQDAFIVDALPSYFAGLPAKPILAEVASTLELAGARGGKGRWKEESIAQAACKTAVKARDRLTLQEIEKLVVDLSMTDMPYTCPHGRPSLIFTSFRELNKKFGRE